MSNPNITPDILATLDEEQSFMKSSGRQRTERIRVPKNHSWLLRFLPAQLGPRKLFFARIASHWHNKRPTLCVCQTSKDFGGNPEARCPLCELSDELNANGSKKVSEAGYRLRAVPQWMVYALVFKKDDGDNEPEDIRGDERWKVQEFWMTKPTFEIFYGMYKKGLNRCTNSILDWESGNDIWVTANSQGRLALDREDPAPITSMKDMDKFDKIIKRITAQIRQPDVRVPDEDQIYELCDKIKEATLGSGSRRSRYVDDEIEEEDDRPSRSSRVDEDDDAPRSRRSSREEESEEDDRRSVRSEPARASSRREEDDNQEEEDDLPYDRDDDERQPAPRREPLPQTKKVQPPTARKISPPPGRSTEAGVDEEEDNAPEERHDHAPVADLPPDVDENDDAPPAVTAPRTAAKSSGLSARLREGIRAADTR